MWRCTNTDTPGPEVAGDLLTRRSMKSGRKLASPKLPASKPGPLVRPKAGLAADRFVWWAMLWVVCAPWTCIPLSSPFALKFEMDILQLGALP